MRLPLLLMGVLLVFAISCLKEDDDNTFTDPRDGKVYRTVGIGHNQEWLAENLAYAPSSGNFWALNNDNENVEVYGYLYDWNTALNVCPAGWHLPSDTEWTILTNYLGENAGGKLKATGTIEAGTGLWRDPNTGATNQTGFTALPCGYRFSSTRFIDIDELSNYWSATEVSDYSTNAWSFQVRYDRSDLDKVGLFKGYGFCVRCVRAKR